MGGAHDISYLGEEGGGGGFQWGVEIFKGGLTPWMTPCKALMRPYFTLVVLFNDQTAFVNCVLILICSLNTLRLFLHSKVQQTLHCLFLVYPIAPSLVFFIEKNIDSSERFRICLYSKKM